MLCFVVFCWNLLLFDILHIMTKDNTKSVRVFECKVMGGGWEKIIALADIRYRLGQEFVSAYMQLFNSDLTSLLQLLYTMMLMQ